MAAILYIAFTKILDGRGILMDLADDCNILAHPEVICELVHQLHALAMSEADLTTQATKNRVYVQSRVD